MMGKRISQFFVVLILSAICSLSIASAASMEEEINHLLNFIKTSDCIFIRNGSRYDPGKAEKHIEKKYKYLKKRIKKTEDFIRGSATQSSMSGKPYMVICNGRETATADWLRAELKEYRSQ